MTDCVRGLVGTDNGVIVSTDTESVASIPQADHVARWDGTAWSAVGAGPGGADGWLPPSTSISDVLADGARIFVPGSFPNAGGDPTADNIASFDGTAWHPPAGLRRRRERPVERHGPAARALPAVGDPQRNALRGRVASRASAATPGPASSARSRSRSSTRRPRRPSRRRRHRPQGANRVTFRGRVAGKSLKPGTYSLTVTATDAAGNASRVAKTTVKVLASRG